MGSTVITDQNVLGISVTSKPMMSEKKMASPMFSVMNTPKTAAIPAMQAAMAAACGNSQNEQMPNAPIAATKNATV
ncbi:hypothetical protein HG66A1_04100 [Gimesia chilikensis]|uniref:Uncharacterized protein n=1 Tax=Gimesia chilikensis TaxID=2605989 RepID=A0A517PGZ7_9PLAN|nr:hypothetical protein HG66A1_04100 [Gimesia chilikensis]